MLKRVTPFNGWFDDNPFFRYAVRRVPGTRSEFALRRYNWIVGWILGGLVFLGWLLVLVLVFSMSGPGYEYLEFSLLYAIGVYLVSLALFPIVDFVAAFYAVVGVRSEMRNAPHFDLLCVSPVDANAYLMGRWGLSQARAWRVFVVMWLLRWIALAFLGVVLLWALIANLDGFNFYPSYWDDLLYIGLIVNAALILVILTLAEPVWRLRLVTALGTSLAARVRGVSGMWLGVGGSLILMSVAQGVFAWVMVRFSNETWELLMYALDVDDWFPGNIGDPLVTHIAMLPYVAIVPVVWLAQRSMTRRLLRSGAAKILRVTDS